MPRLNNVAFRVRYLLSMWELGTELKKNFPVDMFARGLNRSAGCAINLAVFELNHISDIFRYPGDK